VNFIHDEIIVELPFDGSLLEKCNQIEQLMITGMKEVVRNTKIRAEGVIMDRWIKEAKPVYTSTGKLVIYTRDIVPAEKDVRKDTPEELPLLNDLEGLSAEDIQGKTPYGYTCLWNAKKKFYGWLKGKIE